MTGASVEFYRHSGKTGPGVVLVPVFMVPIALLLAFVYTYATVYIPFVGYLSFVLTLAFGAGVGYGTAMLLRSSKVRSPGLCALVGLIIGLVALYFSWATFIHLMIRRHGEAGQAPSFIAVLLSPAGIWGLMREIGKTGWYSLGSGEGFTPKGWVLWLFWVLEAGIIVGLPTLMGGFMIADVVFCERCNRWCDEVKGLLFFEPDAEMNAAERLIQGDLSALETLDKGSEYDDLVLRVDIRRCSQCRDFFTLSFKLVQKVLDDKGNKQDKETALITNMLISGEQHRQLLQMKAAQSAAPAIAAGDVVAAADAAAEPPEPPAGEVSASGTD
jgi:hypothetical protein